MANTDKNVKVNEKKTYLQAIKKSVGSEMFKHIYASIDGGGEKDILNDGELSCAFYVSSLLVVFGLIDKAHATVEKTVEDLKNSGWQEMSQLESAEPGAVILWEEIEYGDGLHKHLGFYVGEDQAISNSWNEGVPVSHHVTFGTDGNGKPKREVQKVFYIENFNG